MKSHACPFDSICLKVGQKTKWIKNSIATPVMSQIKFPISHAKNHFITKYKE